jgi:hypothetical protein
LNQVRTEADRRQDAAESEWTPLRRAAARILGDQRLLWTIAGIVAVQRTLAELPVFLPPGADAYAFVLSGREALTNPGAIYAASAADIAAGHPWTITWPPPQILLAVPFATLPDDTGVWAWAAANGLMAVAGLFFLYRAIQPRRARALPIYVLIALCFTPLFEDIRLGQRGGALVLLAGLAMLLVRSHPTLAGVLTGLGTSIKFYPAALTLSVGGRQWLRFAGATFATAATVLAVSFIPFGSPFQYVTRVLLPVAAGSAGGTKDCFQNSTPLLFSRLVGGEPFTRVTASGVWTTVAMVPWHLPSLAHVLSYLTIGALVAATVWASRRSGWAQPYSMSLAFSLGALIPGDVYTYQFIAVLPLALVLLLGAVERQRWLIVAVAGLAVLTFESSPCALVVPGLWTIAGLALFAAAAIEAPRFRNGV